MQHDDMEKRDVMGGGHGVVYRAIAGTRAYFFPYRTPVLNMQVWESTVGDNR